MPRKKDEVETAEAAPEVTQEVTHSVVIEDYVPEVEAAPEPVTIEIREERPPLPRYSARTLREMEHGRKMLEQYRR